ncbi:MAG TPA: MtrB/PioB family outer membrane beta-barrel protein [Rhizomicrobium sp.]|nr:MtrB/PioB family outer membrane beta-barrel protein [Rhizomicrobium sp.]
MDNLRKFDVANRVEQILHAQSNYIASPKTDLQLTSDWKIDSYSAQYGLHDATSFDINGDVNYQMSTTTTLTGFLTWQDQHRSISNINPQGIPGSGVAGGPDYPFAAAWGETLNDNDYGAGLTAHEAWDKVSLDINYTYTRGDSAVGYSYASPLAFFFIQTAAQAGTSFPDITFDSHSFEANLRWQADASLAYRLLYRVNFQHLNDFHYTDLYPGVINNNVYLGVVPENFTAQVIGVLVQYTF